MTDLQKEIDAYIERYAENHQITKEQALTHAIVKCYEKYKKEGYEIDPMVIAGIEVANGRDL